MLHDLGNAIRSLRRSPGFTLAAIGTLALGLGANSTLFSLVNGVLFRSFPFPESERLVVLSREGRREGDVSIPDAVDLRAESRSLADLAFYWPGWAMDLTGSGDPERLNAAVVEPRFFSILGVTPRLGRVFDSTDTDARLAVLSDALWRTRFGADPALVGKSILLSGSGYTVAGIMPASFSTIDPAIQLWVPVLAETPWAISQRGSNGFEGIARLAPGVTLAQANTELHDITTRLAAQYPQTNGGKVLTAEPIRVWFGEPARPALLALWGAVALLLLITCANLAALLLARGVSRQGASSVRLALGARGRDLIRATVIEGLILAFAGAGAGLTLALWVVPLVMHLAGQSLPRANELGLDGTAVLVSLGAAAITALVFTIVPAWRAGRTSPGAALGRLRSGADPATQRLLGIAVAVESAIALVLLVGCLLLGRTFVRLNQVKLGFEPDRVLSADIVLPANKYGTAEPQTAAFTSMVERVNAVPGVVSAATVISPPLKGDGVGHTVVVEGEDRAESQRAGASSRPMVGDYLGTMRIPILKGRNFTAQDDARSLPVAIVNQTFVRQRFGEGDPIGRRIAFDNGDSLHWMTIVGVAQDVRTRRVADGDAPAVYAPYVQRVMGWQRFGTLMVRAQGDPAGLERQIQAAIWSVDPSVPLSAVQTLPDLVQQTLGRERMSAVISLALAVAALLIAAQGIFALLSFVAGLRRREMALRLALGAKPASVAALVAWRGVKLAGTGLVVGLVAAYGLSRFMSSLLFGVTASDWLSYSAAAGLLLVAALAASAIPARRAARVDPMTTLRSE
jgi:putative ABC transport system permease protein